MIEKVKHKHKVANLKEVCIYLVGFKSNKKVNHAYSQSCETVMHLFDSSERPLKHNVSYTNVHYAIMYTCGKKSFLNFFLALQYSLKKYFPIYFIPPNKLPEKINRYSCVLTLYGCKCFVQNLKIDYIWANIWSKCTYECLFKNNFQNTKSKFADEINNYRKVLKVHPLFSTKQLSDSAQHQAQKMARASRLLNDENKNFDELVAYVEYSNAAFLLKILFYNYYSTNSKFREAFGQKNHFKRLLSKKKNFIGIGIGKTSNGIFVCIKVS